MREGEIPPGFQRLQKQAQLCSYRLQIRRAAHHVHTLQATGTCCTVSACKVVASVFRLLASELEAQAMQHSSALAVA